LQTIQSDQATRSLDEQLFDRRLHQPNTNCVSNTNKTLLQESSWSQRLLDTLEQHIAIAFQHYDSLTITLEKMFTLSVKIWPFSWLPSLVVTEAAMTCQIAEHAPYQNTCALTMECTKQRFFHALTFQPTARFDIRTGRLTPHARPSAALDGTKTYGTFCRTKFILKRSGRKNPSWAIYLV
jgi:hypothetical protein